VLRLMTLVQRGIHLNPECCIPRVRKDSRLDLDDGDRSDYRAVGKIDFFGEGAFTRAWVVAGAWHGPNVSGLSA
jgi:hypothetical protein